MFFYWKYATDTQKRIVIIAHPIAYLYYMKFRHNEDYFNAYINGGTKVNDDFGSEIFMIELILYLLVITPIVLSLAPHILYLKPAGM